jgi:hypothetical protein
MVMAKREYKAKRLREWELLLPNLPKTSNWSKSPLEKR